MYKELFFITSTIVVILTIFTVSEHIAISRMVRNNSPKLPNHVSFMMRNIINNFKPYWKQKDSEGNFINMPNPDDIEGWRKLGRSKSEKFTEEFIQKIKKDFDIETKEHFIRGVRVLEIIPPKIKYEKSVLIYAHPGGLYAYSPESLLSSTASVAVNSKVRVFSIDYRLLPQPEIGLAIKDQAEDVEKVYKGIVKEYGYKPKNIGVWGCSAGSTLFMIAINKMSKEKFPLPGGFLSNGGIYDMTLSGDTIKTMTGLDVVVHPKRYITPVLKMAKIDVNDPEISTLLDDYKNRNWLPIMLVSGGREVLLSDAIRMNTKLKLAGHDSQLYIQDAMPHCWQSIESTKEAREFRKILDGFFKSKDVY